MVNEYDKVSQLINHLMITINHGFERRTPWFLVILYDGRKILILLGLYDMFSNSNFLTIEFLCLCFQLLQQKWLWCHLPD